MRVWRYVRDWMRGSRWLVSRQARAHWKVEEARLGGVRKRVGDESVRAMRREKKSSMTVITNAMT